MYSLSLLRWIKGGVVDTDSLSVSLSFSLWERLGGVATPSFLPSLPPCLHSSILYANMKKGEGKEIMGREGGLSLFLFNRFNLFRFFYLDGPMWLFMLDMIKELNKQILASAASSSEGDVDMLGRAAKYYINICLQCHLGGIWQLFIYLSSSSDCFPTWHYPDIHAVSCKYQQSASPSRNMKRSAEKHWRPKLTTTKLSCDFEINERLKHRCIKY